MSEQYTLPNDWQWVKLGEACEVFSGSSAPQDSKYFKDGKYPFIRVSDLGKYGRTNNLIENRDYINDMAIKELSLNKAEKGTIIFPKSGAAITTNNRAILGKDAFIVSHLAALKAKGKISEPYFIYYWLCLIDMVEYLENPGYPSLKLSTISKIPMPLPPIDDQRRIAAKIQELMQEVKQAKESCKKQLEASQALPSAYLRQVFESEEAKKWERKRLGEIVENSQSGVWGDEPLGIPNEELFPVLRSTEIDHRGNTNADKKTIAIRRIKKESAGKYFLFPDDLLIVRSGGTTGKIILGRVGIYKGEPNKYLFSNFLLRIRLNKQVTNSDYLWFFLNWDKFLENNIPRLMRRTTGIQNLPMDDYFAIPIPLPPKLEQQHIATVLKEKMNESENLQSTLRNQQSTIDALPQAILRKAFRGKLR